MAIKSTADRFDYIGQNPDSHSLIFGTYNYVISAASLYFYINKVHPVDNYVLSQIQYNVGATSTILDVCEIGKYVYIACVVSSAINLYKIDAETDTVTQLASNSLLTDPQKLKWSPNGKYLAVNSSSNNKLMLKFDPVTETFSKVTIPDSTTTCNTIEWSKTSEHLIFFYTGSPVLVSAYHVDESTDTFTKFSAYTDFLSDTTNIFDIEFSPDGQYYVACFNSTTSGQQFSIYKRTSDTTFTKQTLSGDYYLSGLSVFPRFVSWKGTGLSIIGNTGQAYTLDYNRTSNEVTIVKDLSGYVSAGALAAGSKHRMPGAKPGVAWRGTYYTDGTNNVNVTVGVLDSNEPTAISVPDLDSTTNQYVIGSDAYNYPRSVSQDGKWIVTKTESGSSFRLRKRINGSYNNFSTISFDNDAYPSISPDGRWIVAKNSTKDGLALYHYDVATDDFVLFNDQWFVNAQFIVSSTTQLNLLWSISGKRLGVFSPNEAASLYVLEFIPNSTPTIRVSYIGFRAYEFGVDGENFYFRTSASSNTLIMATCYAPDGTYTTANVAQPANSTRSASVGRFVIPFLSNGSSTTAAVRANRTGFTQVTGLSTLLGIPSGMDDPDFKRGVSANGKYLVLQNSSYQYRIYDTSTLPFTEVTNGLTNSSNTGTGNFPVITNDGSLLIIGDTAIVRRSGDIGYYEYPKYGVTVLTPEGPPTIEGNYNYPKFGLSSSAKQPRPVYGNYVYPLFSMSGELNVPIGGNVSYGYSSFGITTTVITTEYEPVISYDVAFKNGSIYVEGNNVGYTLESPGPYGPLEVRYPVFGIESRLNKAENGEGVLTYPIFGVNGATLQPESFEIENRYPQYGLRIETQQNVYSNYEYPVFGMSGFIGEVINSEGELLYPGFRFDGVTDVNRLFGDINYPSYSNSIAVNVIPKPYNGELVYPSFGSSIELDLHNNVRSTINYPKFGLNGEVNVPETAFVGLFYPKLSGNGLINVPETIDISYSYPSFSLNGEGIVPEVYYGSYTFPQFGTDGLVNVPETIDISYEYPSYGFNGNINVPIALLTDGIFYPAMQIVGDIMPTYKVHSEISYPKFGITVWVGYPDQVNSNLHYPKFGLKIKTQGGETEIELKYPKFGVSGNLESYYALNVDSLIGSISVESETWAFKAGRRAVLVRR